jgi:lipid-A-disaccharide synthase
MKIALIAGEVSGDQLGGWLMAALHASPTTHHPPLSFIGVGGEAMQAQGLKSLFPMQDIALMGVFEILPHLFTIKRRLRETIAYIEAEKPDVLVTIDSPGFCTRIVKALRAKGGHQPKYIHYVAPSVWSHRPERARTFAQLFDHLLVLFPFEPPYFEREGLNTTYIGHQVAFEWNAKGDGAAFRARHSIDETAPLLAVFPGSRHGELNRMLPIFARTITQLHEAVSGLRCVMQVPSHLVERMTREARHWPQAPLILSSTEQKKDLFAAATAALAKSGTVAMECAFAGLPLVVTYKANPISAALVRRLLTIRYVHIANLMADREIIPERIQERCNPKELTAALLPLLRDETARQSQRQALLDFATNLGAADTQSPSDKAAEIILNSFKAH